MKTVFLSGKITGDPDYRAKFEYAQQELEEQEFIVMDPSVLPPKGFDYLSYLRISTAMLEACGAVCFLPNWRESSGAQYEFGHAAALNKDTFYYEVWARENIPEAGVVHASA